MRHVVSSDTWLLPKGWFDCLDTAPAVSKLKMTHSIGTPPWAL